MTYARHAVKLIALLLLTATAAAAQPEQPLKIVTSIKPLALLTQAVAPADTEIHTLIPAGASPHTYQLRPSDRRALADADLILWVGPELETFLEHLLESPEMKDRTLALMPDDIKAHEGAHEEHAEHHEEAEHEHHDEAGHDHAAEEEHEHHHHGVDPHVWLDPQIALTMTRAIEARLAQVRTDQADAMAGRLADFETALEMTEGDIRNRLTSLHDVDIFTYHDAFRRFAEHYGLHVSQALTLTPERSPGARHLAKVREELGGAAHPCLMTEPQFSRDWWQGLTEDLNLTITTWDPLGSDIPLERDGYLQFQQSLADAALSCLGE
ncbi:zinc ABC transporter substrate-binding protein [Marinobacter bohaiensis]|uniref:zinc ABC transporter substrate-binding protein n=1 Tax=Marinobacter bohaiensis TaxID=2201898 RepID=UPI000DACA5ED|nr:zinc ABC transporter substrate-binding protein [Marinobacter bohaiensis]